MGAVDKRCRHWNKIVRKNDDIPMPDKVTSSKNIPTEYLQDGCEELFEGDFWLECEEKHHRNPRGWCYKIHWMDSEGKLKSVKSGGEVKARLKEAGLHFEFLPGSGEVAAMVRIIHAYRQGIEL